LCHGIITECALRSVKSQFYNSGVVYYFNSKNRVHFEEMHRLFFISCYLLFMVDFSSAYNTYYVSATGNNNNTGSALRPWKTISYAVIRIGSADTLIVREGNYTEDYGILINRARNPNINGTPAKYTEIKAEGKVNISIKNPTADNDNPQSAIVLSGFANEPVSYVKISGFTIVNHRLANAIALNYATNCAVENNMCCVVNSAADYNKPYTNEGANGICLKNCKNCTVIGNNCSNIFAWGYFSEYNLFFSKIFGIKLESSDNNLIQKNILNDITSNEFSCPTGGIYLESSNNNRIDCNIILRPAQYGHGNGGKGTAYGIYVSGCANTVISGNFLSGSSQPEAKFHGIFAEFDQDSQVIQCINITNNRLSNHKHAIILNPGKNTAAQVSNNVILNCVYPFEINRNDTQGTYSAVFSNNVCDTFIKIVIRDGSNSPLTIFNNIFYSPVTLDNPAIVFEEISSGDIYIDYNCYSGTILSLSDYQYSGSHNISVLNPCFRDRDSGNYQLVAQSPCLTAGENLTAQGIFGGINALEDTDNDGIPDICESASGTNPIYSDDTADPDNDTVTNFIEYLTGSNPFCSDTESDGLSDTYEINSGLNPLSADSDSDSISDYDELNITCTNPVKQDTDGDFIIDGRELSIGTNPALEDSDNDGLNDLQEVYGLYFINGFFYDIGICSNPNIYDTNGNGISDYDEIWADPDNDGLNNYEETTSSCFYRGSFYETGFCSDPNLYDTDNDGVSDREEIWSGTDPDNDQSYFRIISCEQENDTIRITYYESLSFFYQYYGEPDNDFDNNNFCNWVSYEYYYKCEGDSQWQLLEMPEEGWDMYYDFLQDEEGEWWPTNVAHWKPPSIPAIAGKRVVLFKIRAIAEWEYWYLYPEE